MAAACAPPPLDKGQIKKAVHALLAHHKTRQKTGEKVLLNEDLNFFLTVTVWKIPACEQVVKITLPHGILPASAEVCLFTKDEPGLTAEQTENLYKKLLSQHGITKVSEVICYKTLKSEYKSFEAKRRLLNRFSLFLSDDRIRRLLPSHIGKHFYRSKKSPLSVNLKATKLDKEINGLIQGTTLPVTNKGCCFTARVGHTGMTAEKIVENVIAIVAAIAAKAPKVSRSIKILHLKTEKSVALPIFHRSHPGSEALQKSTGIKGQKIKKKNKKKKNQTNESKGQTPGKARELAANVPAPGSLKREKEVEISDAVGPEQEDDEGIPLLVPIETCVQKDKVAETRPSPKKGVEVDPKGLLPGKRKSSLSLEAPITELEIPKDGSSLKTPKLLKRGKIAKPPKQEVTAKELAKTSPKPETKSAVNPRRKKAVMSAKKALRTPKQAVRKTVLLKSV
ncbi:ribosomal L1 domain-containing protein 1 [Eublepharis macularius]|uniref:Ribosomal L1 domain-containing protein 1 n=1 Tax=Eublepharis macularius TaxID=481883 RepID=A0AA97K1A8_EUBMA|nr:ribosomal L1 domain-containing protein 1 [Eublepharis macularius]